MPTRCLFPQFAFWSLLLPGNSHIFVQECVPSNWELICHSDTMPDFCWDLLTQPFCKTELFQMAGCPIGHYCTYASHLCIRIDFLWSLNSVYYTCSGHIIYADTLKNVVIWRLIEYLYIQAIEAAIELNLSKVEAGAQGEHKIQRGYLPVTTYSCHYFVEPGFATAIGNFLVHETAQVTCILDVLLEIIQKYSLINEVEFIFFLFASMYAWYRSSANCILKYIAFRIATQPSAYIVSAIT